MYSCSIKSNLIGLNMYIPPLTIFLGAQEAQRFDSVFAYSGSLFQHKSLSYLLGMDVEGGEAEDGGEGFSGGGGVIVNKHEIGYEHGLVNVCVTKQPDYHRRNLYIWDFRITSPKSEIPTCLITRH